VYPWEYDIYINLLNEYLENEAQEKQKQLMQNKY
jgi:hypothetical protein